MKTEYQKMGDAIFEILRDLEEKYGDEEIENVGKLEEIAEKLLFDNIQRERRD